MQGAAPSRSGGAADVPQLEADSAYDVVDVVFPVEVAVDDDTQYTDAILENDLGGSTTNVWEEPSNRFVVIAGPLFGLFAGCCVHHGSHRRSDDARHHCCDFLPLPRRIRQDDATSPSQYLPPGQSTPVYNTR